MHKIEAFLPPSTNVDSLEETLFAAGVVSFSTTEMQVFDRKEMKTVKYRGVERVIRHNRKLKLEIIAGRIRSAWQLERCGHTRKKKGYKVSQLLSPILKYLKIEELASCPPQFGNRFFLLEGLQQPVLQQP